MPGVYALPGQPSTPRWAFGQWTRVDASSVALGTLPRTGTVLVAGTTSDNQSTNPTISGGGAAWTRIGRAIVASGSQVEVDLWVGVVGSSPSTSVSFGPAGSAQGFVFELEGPIGKVLAATTASMANTTAIAGGAGGRSMSLILSMNRSVDSSVIPPGYTAMIYGNTGGGHVYFGYKLNTEGIWAPASPFSFTSGNWAVVSGIIG